MALHIVILGFILRVWRHIVAVLAMTDVPKFAQTKFIETNRHISVCPILLILPAQVQQPEFTQNFLQVSPVLLSACTAVKS